MMGMPLHLLRHGAPETPGLLLGRTDSVPTRAGIDACLAQAEGLEIEMIVTSDLQRARQAATAIGERAGLPVWVDPRWRELDFGIWDGLAPADVDPEGSPVSGRIPMASRRRAARDGRHCWDGSPMRSRICRASPHWC